MGDTDVAARKTLSSSPQSTFQDGSVQRANLYLGGWSSCSSDDCCHGNAGGVVSCTVKNQKLIVRSSNYTHDMFSQNFAGIFFSLNSVMDSDSIVLTGTKIYKIYR